jgi:hypothetical protein
MCGNPDVDICILRGSVRSPSPSLPIFSEASVRPDPHTCACAYCICMYTCTVQVQYISQECSIFKYYSAAQYSKYTSCRYDTYTFSTMFTGREFERLIIDQKCLVFYIYYYFFYRLLFSRLKTVSLLCATLIQSWDLLYGPFVVSKSPSSSIHVKRNV